MVFAEVALGAIVLTINVILLGGELVFFQVWAPARTNTYTHVCVRAGMRWDVLGPD